MAVVITGSKWFAATRRMRRTCLPVLFGLLLASILLVLSPAGASAYTSPRECFHSKCDMGGEWVLTLASGSHLLQGVAVIVDGLGYSEGPYPGEEAMSFQTNDLEWEGVEESCGGVGGELSPDSTGRVYVGVGSDRAWSSVGCVSSFSLPSFWPVEVEGKARSVEAGGFESKAMTLREGSGNAIVLTWEGSVNLYLLKPDLQPSYGEENIRIPATLTMTKLRSEKQVEEKIRKEAEERQAQEKAAQEKVEQEAREREARVKEEVQRKEAAEKTIREGLETELNKSREREALEAKEKAVKVQAVIPTSSIAALASTISTGNRGVTITLVPAAVTSKTLAVGHGGTFSLRLTNPNGLAIHGHLKLTLAKGGKASSVNGATLSEASFSIPAGGSEIVKLKLPRSARSQITDHKNLGVIATVTTEASGVPSVSKAFDLTVHAS
jgi:hypothetical protein